MAFQFLPSLHDRSDGRPHQGITSSMSHQDHHNPTIGNPIVPNSQGHSTDISTPYSGRATVCIRCLSISTEIQATIMTRFSFPTVSHHNLTVMYIPARPTLYLLVHHLCPCLLRPRRMSAQHKWSISYITYQRPSKHKYFRLCLFPISISG
jgi:hypothetical protein